MSFLNFIKFYTYYANNESVIQLFSFLKIKLNEKEDRFKILPKLLFMSYVFTPVPFVYNKNRKIRE